MVDSPSDAVLALAGILAQPESVLPRALGKTCPAPELALQGTGRTAAAPQLLSPETLAASGGFLSPPPFVFAKTPYTDSRFCPRDSENCIR
jgi:hypothetical protein